MPGPDLASFSRDNLFVYSVCLDNGNTLIYPKILKYAPFKAFLSITMYVDCIATLFTTFKEWYGFFIC